MENIALTQYSHGAGCGCKLSPKVLNQILASYTPTPSSDQLIVGNLSRDDAAVYHIGDGHCVISTTDFFMPIVDDPFDFGRIAATNAISDIYAMGGKPIMALAILGWPIDKLAPEIAGKVIEGARSVCQKAGIELAGGHSIDSPEPIFGLAVTGTGKLDQIKQNSKATADCDLFLTKPLGIGLLTSAEKKKQLKPEHKGLAVKWMCESNVIGQQLAEFSQVKAITDVTGFGLLGHLIEVCNGSNLDAHIDLPAIPLLPGVEEYIELGTIPGGTHRNYDSVKHMLGEISDFDKAILCDPQTSGGLLLAVEKSGVNDMLNFCRSCGVTATRIGSLTQPANSQQPQIKIER
ncbi:selenide, water dikinase SelD [Vibrio sp. CyArs1]|uniref:selenide, water dikinase SelD n=1 Tax=Vibrio sp. CyArs1 TaxID=2682577 RepID=UPI001F055DED|nr:selenide, water dikinase SelD [Vibrio sp. CyArs1]